jgi:hypothetical protein
MKRDNSLTITKLFPSGMWLVSDIINNQLVTRRYMGHTKREAIALFKKETKQERA